MRRTFLVVLLGAGVVFGFGSGIRAALGFGGWDGPCSHDSARP